MPPSAIIRAAFVEASEYFVATSSAVPDGHWDRPALGVWSMRDLVGHTSRSLLTVEAYLAGSAAHVDLHDPTEYFLATLAGMADEAAVAERGRQAGAALGGDPVQSVRDIAARVVPLVQRAADDALVGTPWGGMKLIDYLPTRVFELSIHTLDLAAALGLQGDLPEPSSRVTWGLIADLARRRGVQNDILRALTGRSGLSPGFTILAAERT